MVKTWHRLERVKMRLVRSKPRERVDENMERKETRDRHGAQHTEGDRMQNTEAGVAQGPRFPVMRAELRDGCRCS